MTDSLQRIVAELRELAADSRGCLASTRCKQIADRLERLSAAEQKVTEKMVLVPRDPTGRMWSAFDDVADITLNQFRSAYAAMLRAACESQKSDVGGDGRKEEA